MLRSVYIDNNDIKTSKKKRNSNKYTYSICDEYKQ